MSQWQLDLSLLEDDKKPITTEQILENIRSRQRTKQKTSPNIRMKGKTQFSIPDAEKLRVIQNNESLERKKQFTKDLAPEEVQQGIIQLVNLERKGEEEKKKEDAKD